MHHSGRGILVAAVVLAACSGGGDDGAADTTAVRPPATATTASTAQPVASTAASTVASTTTSSTTTTSTTTTAAPTPAQVACATLTTASYLARRDLIANLADPAGTAATCGDAITATEQANAIAAASASIDGDALASELGIACGVDGFTVVLDDSPFPFWIGLLVVMRTSARDGSSVATAPGGAVVLWSIQPDRAGVISGDLAGDPAAEGCLLAAEPFVNNDSSLPGDAGLPPAYPVVVPDPATPDEWLPLLVERQLAAHRAGNDPLLVPLYEDVRSAAFARLTDPAQIDPSVLVDTDLTVRVCEQIGRLDENRVALVYESTRTRYVTRLDGVDTDAGPYQRLSAAVFRRGQDGLWRWIAGSVEIQSPTLTTCDAWSAATAA